MQYLISILFKAILSKYLQGSNQESLLNGFSFMTKPRAKNKNNNGDLTNFWMILPSNKLLGFRKVVLLCIRFIKRLVLEIWYEDISPR